MKNRRSAAVSALIAAAGLAASAHAQWTDATLNWNNAAGGSAATAANWSPSVVPGSSDDLFFSVAGSFPVTFGAGTATSRTQTYKQGAVTLTASSPHTISTLLVVADQPSETATLTLTTGSLSAGASPCIVGNGSGSTGVLNVNASDADLFLTAVAGNFTVGNNGAGTLNVTGEGRVHLSHNILAGNAAAAVGTVLVSGGLLAPPFGRSTLDVQGTGETRIGNAGDATLTVSNGALAQFAGNVTVGATSQSTSSITAQTQALFDATLTIGGDLSLGRNATAGLAAGSGMLTANNGGSVTVGGALRVGGDPDGGTGVLRINAGGVVAAHDIIAGAGGDLQHVGGTMVIDGGTLVNDTPAINISNTLANNPVLRLINGGQASAMATANPGRALTIGGNAGASTGTLDLQSGGSMLVFASPIGGVVDAAVADGSDDTGTLTVAGAGSSLQCTNNNSTLAIGLDGDATCSITSGGLVNFGTVNIAASATSTSAVTVDGTGSELEARVQLNVGGNAGGLGGIATLTAGNGGSISVPTASATAARIWQDGHLVLNTGGDLTTTGTLDIRTGGLLTMAGGTCTAGTVLVANNADINGHGTVTGNISLANGAGVAADGPLFLGKATSPTGFAMSSGSSLNVGAFPVNLLDSANVPLAAVTIAGGTLTCGNAEVGSGASITGFGLLDATVALSASGVLTAAGTGLRFDGTVVRFSGGTMSGTLFGFNSGGGFNGQGTISGTVDFDAGSVCTNTGILTMGNASDPAGVTLDGTLHVGNGTVTLLDSTGVSLGSTTDLNGGDLVCALNLSTGIGRTIEGTGTVHCPTLNVFGNVRPGDLASQPPQRGTLNVSGNVLLGPAQTYFCDIDPGVEFAASDRIQSTGAAQIGGALSVAFINGYTPHASDVFDIVIGSSRTGVFSSTSIPPVGSFGPAHVEYLSDRARLVMCYANCDGSVVSLTLNVLDFSCFLNKFAAGDPYANCDGSTTPPTLNVLDFACFLNKFAAGCP